MNMFDILASCAGGTIQFEDVLPSTISAIVNILKIAIPIMVIIFGLIDLGKAVMAQKEDEIKKGQQTFLKRLMAAAIVFFVVVIAEFLVGLLAKDDTEKSTITGCIDKIVDCANKSACK